MARKGPASNPPHERDAAPEEAAESLRARATVKLRDEDTLTPELSVWETAKLIQELRVHQIELEMQNEELRRAQSELETSRSCYADLYDFAPVGYFVLDGNGLIASANLTGASLLGVERDRLIGKPLRLYLRRDSQDQFHRYQLLIHKTGRRQTCEVGLVRRDHAEVFVQLSGEMIENDGTAAGRLRVALTDITERKRAQEEIVNLARFPAENPCPVLRLSGAGVILYANAAAGALLERWRRQVGRRAPENWCQVIEDIMRSGQPGVREVSLGDHVFSLVFAPFPEVDYVNVYGNDITRRKRAEKALRKHQDHLEELVRSRTQELSKANVCLIRETGERECLQEQILQVCEMEQRRIGQELHDTIGQQFAGIGFLLKGFESRLLKGLPDEGEAFKEIRELMNDALRRVKNLAKGLHPVDLEAGGLAAALESLASRSEQLFGVSCAADIDESISMESRNGGIHLYRIAQEAITNAVKHGKARDIGISLAEEDGGGVLRIQNDGRPFSSGPRTGGGMGLHLMKYRAEMVSGRFEVRVGDSGGTVVTCTFPISESNLNGRSSDGADQAISGKGQEYEKDLDR